MKKVLEALEEMQAKMPIETVFLILVIAFIVAMIIYLTYKNTYTGVMYNPRFNVSLVMITMVTTIVMVVIGSNISVSLGMVGALSIVRFRTAIKDSRDTVYIFWTIIAGICCGVGDYLVVSIGSAVVFLIMLLFGRIKSNNRILLVIKANRIVDLKIEGIVFDYFNHAANLKVKNTTRDSVEYIYELSAKTYNKSLSNKESITDTLYKNKEVDYVNIVIQPDDISG